MIKSPTSFKFLTTYIFLAQLNQYVSFEENFPSCINNFSEYIMSL